MLYTSFHLSLSYYNNTLDRKQNGKNEAKIYLIKKIVGYLTYMYVFLEKRYQNITLSFLWNRSLVSKIWALSERQLSSIVRKRAQQVIYSRTSTVQSQWNGVRANIRDTVAASGQKDTSWCPSDELGQTSEDYCYKRF